MHGLAARRLDSFRYADVEEEVWVKVAPGCEVKDEATGAPLAMNFSNRFPVRSKVPRTGKEPLTRFSWEVGSDHQAGRLLVVLGRSMWMRRRSGSCMVDGIGGVRTFQWHGMHMYVFPRARNSVGAVSTPLPVTSLLLDPSTGMLAA